MNILLIEDDPGIGRFVTRGLSAEGFDVQWLRTGREGEARLKRQPFAAAILDLGLPDMDGLELCGAVRRSGVATPILMLTARGALEDKLDGFRSGADDYLPSPSPSLNCWPASTCWSGAADRPRRSSPGPCGLIRRHGWRRSRRRPSSCRTREFQLLICLASAGGEVVERQAILTEVWGPDTDVADNTLDVYIGYLRRRLTVLPGAPHVMTIRGKGFRLAAGRDAGIADP